MQPILTGEEPSPEKLASFEQRMSDCLDVMENEWLKQTDYLVNNQFSAADLWAACEIEQLSMTIIFKENLKMFNKIFQDLLDMNLQLEDLH